MLDVFGSGAEACVSSQHLDIPQAAANLADPPRCTRDERPPAAMARTADHPEPGIQPVKPYSDRARRQTPVPLAVDDRPIWMCPAVSLFMESHERCLKVRVHWNMATTALTLGRPVLQRDHIGDFARGIGDHRPSDSRDLLCPQPGPELSVPGVRAAAKSPRALSSLRFEHRYGLHRRWRLSGSGAVNSDPISRRGCLT
jgi:hypothetical protein